MLSIGVDLGGTNLRAGIVDTVAGRVLSSARGPTYAEEGPPAVIERMAALINQAISEARLATDEIVAIGIGVPGLYDPATNAVRFLPNLPTTWLDVPLGREIELRVGRPTALVNDARAFVLAEATFGAGRGANIVIGLTLGTGIGGGIVIGGQIVLGHDGSAGEFGHHIIDLNGPRCGCGSRGCLEAHASGPAIATMGIKAVRQGRTTVLRDLIDGDLNRMTPEVIVRAAEMGDPVAREIMDEAGLYLGIGVANLVKIFSPDVVVIGGGVSQAGDWLLKSIRQVVSRHSSVTYLDRVSITLAALGGDAGIIGAALWATRVAQSRKRL